MWILTKMNSDSVFIHCT